MTHLADTDRALRDLLLPRLSEAGREALTAARHEILAGCDDRTLGRRFAAIARQVGRGPLVDGQEPAPLAGATDAVDVAAWSLPEGARASLLLAAACAGPPAALERAVPLYDRGETGERIAVLKALALLEEADTALPAVQEGCRSNILPLFDVATANPYASRWLSDHDFNHAMLKRATLGLPLGLVVRLFERGGPELARMLLGLVRERQISSRPVPADAVEIADLLAPRS
jgi:hypothetical protein